MSKSDAQAANQDAGRQMSSPIYKTVLLFGPPGVGKGTQGKILGAIPGFVHWACGDAFRSIDPNSEMGKVFYEYSSRGELVPDAFTVQLWQQAIAVKAESGEYDTKRDLLILDGIPRTVEQAHLMDGQIEVLKVISIVCEDREAMFERLRRRALKQNRHEDADEMVIHNRWDVYERETAPVLAHYPARSIANVEATGSPAQVLLSILALLEPLQNRHFTPFEG